MILGDGVNGTFRQIPGNGTPVFTLVVAAQDVRCVVAFFVVIKGGVDHILIKQGGLNITDITHIRHILKFGGFAPTPAAVFADLYQPVIGAHIKQALFQSRLIQGNDTAIE